VVHLTSDLASLLPQRRRNQRDAEDDDSGDDSDASAARGDEDELAYSRGTRTRRGSRSRGRAGSARPSSRAGARGAAQPQSAARGRATPGTNGRVRQTYGSRADGADDSFAPLPDDSFADGPAEVDDPKEELKKAASKFKEVDKWELEFEEAEAVAESSSQDGR
jgi:ATP-dependent RNA helicase MRH4